MPNLVEAIEAIFEILTVLLVAFVLGAAFGGGFCVAIIIAASRL